MWRGPVGDGAPVVVSTCGHPAMRCAALWAAWSPRPESNRVTGLRRPGRTSIAEGRARALRHGARVRSGGVAVRTRVAVNRAGVATPAAEYRPIPGVPPYRRRRPPTTPGVVRSGRPFPVPYSFRAEPQRGVEPRPTGWKPVASPLRLLRRGRPESEWQDSNLRPSAPKADGPAWLPHTRSSYGTAAHRTPSWTDRESNPELLLARQV